jgi:hypothetical protein
MLDRQLVGDAAEQGRVARIENGGQVRKQRPEDDDPSGYDGSVAEARVDLGLKERRELA